MSWKNMDEYTTSVIYNIFSVVLLNFNPNIFNRLFLQIANRSYEFMKTVKSVEIM